MIYAFTGKTGSGKTYQMVKIAYRYWLSGVDIYSNTILSFEKYAARINQIEKFFWFLRHYITFKFVTGQYRAKKRGRIIYFEDISEILEARDGIILFDEAQVLFNSRLWEALPAEFTYKLQQHRKHKLDLFCTTQSMGAIDIAYRRLVQKWYHCNTIIDISKFKLLGLYRMDFKDVDELYIKVDDLIVTTLKSRYKLIFFRSKRLYDTLYDIGFKRFKTLWFKNWDPMKNLVSKTAWIIPKEMKLSDARKQMSLYELDLGLKRSSYLRPN